MIEKLAHGDESHELSFLEQNDGIDREFTRYFTAALQYLPQLGQKVGFGPKILSEVSP
jgi:hypothetical protein